MKHGKHCIVKEYESKPKICCHWLWGQNFLVVKGCSSSKNGPVVNVSQFLLFGRQRPQRNSYATIAPSTHLLFARSTVHHVPDLHMALPPLDRCLSVSDLVVMALLRSQLDTNVSLIGAFGFTATSRETPDPSRFRSDTPVNQSASFT